MAAVFTGCAPIRVTVAIVGAQEVHVFLRILGDLQRLIDRVEEVVGQVGRQIDEFCSHACAPAVRDEHNRSHTARA